MMDKLAVLKKAEELGEPIRRKRLEYLIREARELGCQSEVGGGKSGGINFRYGSIRYAILDVNVDGEVKIYVQPHPNKKAPEALSEELKKWIFKNEEEMPLKSESISHYGHLKPKVEEIPRRLLSEYLKLAVNCILKHYYCETDLDCYSGMEEDEIDSIYT